MLTSFLPTLKYLNIVEIDNVCDSGNEILTELRYRIV